jgi:hypothetical protein
MASSTTLRIEGLDAAQADIARWVKSVPGVLAQATQPLGAQIVGDIQGRVPVVSGRMQASVAVLPQQNVPDGSGGIQIGMGNDELTYPSWVEFGGSRGRPLVPEGRWVHPTVIRYQPAFDELVERAINSSIDSFPWSKPNA